MAPAGNNVSDPNRREFLAHVGGAAATVAGVASLATDAAAHERRSAHDPNRGRTTARQRSIPGPPSGGALPADKGVFSHPINGDERRYPNRIGSFSKTLPHNANGEVDPAAFNALVNAMSTANPDDFEAIRWAAPRSSPTRRPGSPSGSCGVDAQSSRIAAAPRFAGAETAAEMVELYWAALTRDVPFDMFASDPTIAAAAADLSTLTHFQGPKSGGMPSRPARFSAARPPEISSAPTSRNCSGSRSTTVRTSSTRGCA